MKFSTTVIIPTKDRADMLLRAILSVSQQSLLPDKVIIVDDGSSEPVSELLFSKINNLDITIINNKVSLGGAISRNIGIKNASTKYISFLDDDDSWDCEYLSEVKKVLDIHPSDNSAVYASKSFVLSSSLKHVFRESIVTDIVTKEDLLKGNLVGTTSCVTVSKKALSDINSFDANLPALQDYDCWFRLSSNSLKFYPVPSAVVYYTISVSSTQISGNYNNHINARKIILDKNKDLLSKSDFLKLNGILAFFTAKAIHRKNYIASMKYTFRAIIVTKKLKVCALLIPYKIFKLLGIYTS